MKYWLMKSEPSVFGIDALSAAAKKTSPWDGVRNYQARNMLRDQFTIGDQAFFYHSSCKEPGIVGIVNVVKAGYPDFTALNPKDSHYDPTSTPENPRWYMVDVCLKEHFKRVISLDELRRHESKELSGMLLLRRGNRLSITPLVTAHWQFIVSLV